MRAGRNFVLKGMAAAGEDDVWAVGFLAYSGSSRSFYLHWDGRTWNPNEQYHSFGDSLSANIGSNEDRGATIVGGDTWIVGSENVFSADHSEGLLASRAVISRHAGPPCVDPTPIPTA